MSATEGSPPARRGAGPWAAAGLWLILVAALALAYAATRPPAPRPADAAPGRFSAVRAMGDIRAIGREAHPTGSVAIERVRRHVLERLNALGAPAQIHMGEGVNAPRWAPSRLAAATVQNVVGVLPGRDRSLPAVAVMAHYDSTPNSPGAADDAAGVAVLLQTAQALADDARAGRPPLRDVVFLATDGEEAGLLGAQAFFATDPLARHIGVVVNMEARGDAGRAAMFQTGPRAGALVRLYARAAEHPYAGSFTAFLASLLPNDTDFTVARAHGIGGLNLAFIGDQLAYHTPLATPDHLSQGALQSLGGQALPAAVALAFAPRLPAPAADLAYADLPGLGVVGYAAVAGGWAATALAALLVGVAAWRAWRLGLVDGAGVLQGAGLAALAALAAALALQLAGGLLGGGADLFALYRLLGRFDLLLAGSALLAAGVAAGVYAGAGGLGRRSRGGLAGLAVAAGVVAALTGGGVAALGLGAVVAALAGAVCARATGPWAAWTGALALGLVLAVALQALAPMLAPLALWPLLPAALGAVLVFGAGERTARAALLLAGLLAVAATALALDWGAGLFTALGPSLPSVAALAAGLALPALAPFVRLSGTTRAGAAAAVVAGAVGAALLLAAGLHAGTRARPALTSAYAVAEASAPGAPATHSWRAAPRLDAWTRRLLGPTPVRRDFADGRRAWAAPSQPWAQAAPEVDVSTLDGRLTLTVRATGPTRELRLSLRGAALSDPRLDARPVAWPASAQGVRELRFAAPPPEGVTVSFAAPAHGRARLFVEALADGWPPSEAPPPLPPGLMGFGDSGTASVGAPADIVW